MPKQAFCSDIIHLLKPLRYRSNCGRRFYLTQDAGRDTKQTMEERKLQLITGVLKDFFMFKPYRVCTCGDFKSAGKPDKKMMYTCKCGGLMSRKRIENSIYGRDINKA